jgi:hypothetical protein
VLLATSGFHSSTCNASVSSLEPVRADLQLSICVPCFVLLIRSTALLAISNKLCRGATEAVAAAAAAAVILHVAVHWHMGIGYQ